MSRSERVRRVQEDEGSDALSRTMRFLASESASRRNASVDRLERRGDRLGVAPSFVGEADGALPENVRDLIVTRVARKSLRDLILPQYVQDEVAALVNEQAEVALLRSHSLEPRHSVLLVGPPGNGKTSLAEALANELGLAFLTLRYDGVVDSFLGETASRIRRVMEYARAAPCLLFLDEFDAIGKDRGDANESGEIRRVVNSLLLHLDAMPSHCVVVCATNHPELLDRAVWRRFELRMELPLPGPTEISAMFDRLSGPRREAEVAKVEYLALMSGRSMSEIEQFNLEVRRQVVLSRNTVNMTEALYGIVRRWEKRFDPCGESGVHGETTHRKDYAPTGRHRADTQ